MQREEDSNIQRERVEQAPPLQTQENGWRKPHPYKPKKTGGASPTPTNPRKRVEQAPPLQTQENGWSEPHPYKPKKPGGASPTPTNRRKLLARFELGGDQTNLVNAGAAHDIDGAGDVHEQYIVVAF